VRDARRTFCEDALHCSQSSRALRSLAPLPLTRRRRAAAPGRGAAALVYDLAEPWIVQHADAAALLDGDDGTAAARRRRRSLRAGEGGRGGGASRFGGADAEADADGEDSAANAARRAEA
jgi:hypothetical protein